MQVHHLALGGAGLHRGEAEAEQTRQPGDRPHEIGKTPAVLAPTGNVDAREDDLPVAARDERPRLGEHVRKRPGTGRAARVRHDAVGAPERATVLDFHGRPGGRERKALGRDAPGERVGHRRGGGAGRRLLPVRTRHDVRRPRGAERGGRLDVGDATRRHDARDARAPGGPQEPHRLGLRGGGDGASVQDERVGARRRRGAGGRAGAVEDAPPRRLERAADAGALGVVEPAAHHVQERGRGRRRGKRARHGERRRYSGRTREPSAPTIKRTAWPT